jgi:histidinol-phosphate aminotransferase
MSCDFIHQALPAVQCLSPYQPGKPEAELRRELGLAHIVKLASNENPLGCSPRATAAMQASLPHVARYPDGNGYALKQALATRLEVAPECITLGNGSNDVLELLGRAYLGPGRHAVFSEHAFAVYPLVVQAVGAEARVAPALATDSAMPYGHDLVAFRQRIDHDTCVVFIANPNNPTGTWLGAAELADFVAAVPPHTLVVIDEAYYEYAESPDYASVVPWLDRWPILVVVRTFSKAYGLAGLRVGYALSHPKVADVLNRVRQPFNVNSLALSAAEAALDDSEFLSASRAVNRQGAVQLQAACERLGLTVLPSAANFLCIDLARPSAPIFERLLQRGVIVRPIAGYGLPNALRVTIGTSAENQHFITALTEVLATA